MKYRKKPVEVEAIQFLYEDGDGNNTYEACSAFCGDKAAAVIWYDDHQNVHMNFYINTLEGRMTAVSGDWVIKGIAGEFYPVKNDIFEKTYEKVEEWEQKTQQYLNETGKDRL